LGKCYNAKPDPIGINGVQQGPFIFSPFSQPPGDCSLAPGMGLK